VRAYLYHELHEAPHAEPQHLQLAQSAGAGMELQRAVAGWSLQRFGGFAIGVASHGIGTARAFQVSEQAGAFAALAMGLNGALTALLLPLVLGWLG
jgi:putative effector of murein hydrolase